MDEEQVVRPRKGRVSAFTSGKENPHRVERVTGMSSFFKFKRNKGKG